MALGPFVTDGSRELAILARIDVLKRQLLEDHVFEMQYVEVPSGESVDIGMTSGRVDSLNAQIDEAIASLAASRVSTNGKATAGGSLTPAVGAGTWRTPSIDEGVDVCGVIVTRHEYRLFAGARLWCDRGYSAMDVTDPISLSDSWLTWGSPSQRNERDQFPIMPGIQYTRYSNNYLLADLTGVVDVPAELWEFQSRGTPIMRYGAIYKGRTFWRSDDGTVYHAQLDASDSRHLDMVIGVINMMALGVVMAPLALNIGTAVVGSEIAAAYPAVANAVGQLAVTTARNGGDVEAAVKGGLLTLVGTDVGMLAGGAVSSVIDVDYIAQAAAVAARAAVTGGDVNTAVLSFALQSGARAADNALNATDGEPDMPDFDFTTPSFGTGFNVDADFMTGAGSGGFSSDAVQNINLTPDDPAGHSTFSWDDWSANNTPVDYAFGGTITPGFSSPELQPAATGMDARGALSFVTDAAMAAVRVNQAYQASQRPGPTVAVARPPGAAVRAPDGRIIVNNGNGTATTTYPDGRVVTASIAGAASSATPWLLGIGAVAAFFMS